MQTVKPSVCYTPSPTQNSRCFYTVSSNLETVHLKYARQWEVGSQEWNFEPATEINAAEAQYGP
jgi:hypothetical protein